MNVKEIRVRMEEVVSIKWLTITALASTDGLERTVSKVRVRLAMHETV